VVVVVVVVVVSGICSSRTQHLISLINSILIINSEIAVFIKYIHAVICQLVSWLLVITFLQTVALQLCHCGGCSATYEVVWQGRTSRC